MTEPTPQIDPAMAARMAANAPIKPAEAAAMAKAVLDAETLATEVRAPVVEGH